MPDATKSSQRFTQEKFYSSSQDNKSTSPQVNPLVETIFHEESYAATTEAAVKVGAITAVVPTLPSKIPSVCTDSQKASKGGSITDTATAMPTSSSKATVTKATATITVHTSQSALEASPSGIIFTINHI